MLLFDLIECANDHRIVLFIFLLLLVLLFFQCLSDYVIGVANQHRVGVTVEEFVLTRNIRLYKWLIFL